jgi:putative homogalacturonan methyltransferase
MLFIYFEEFSCRYFKLKKCISKASSVEEIAIGSINKWPDRLSKPSSRASLIDNGASLFEVDSQKWVRRVSYYKKSLGVKLGTAKIRNVMDMNAFFGGFAAAVVSDPVWVMNVVPAQKPYTLGVIYDRGLIGVYHDWYVSNTSLIFIYSNLLKFNNALLLKLFSLLFNS